MTTHLAGDPGRTLCGLDASGASIVATHPTCEECRNLDAERKARFDSIKPQTAPPHGQRRPQSLGETVKRGGKRLK
jgi:hypothetical protein